MPELTPEDRQYIRLIRRYLGHEWSLAKPQVIASMPDDLDPAMIAKYVDERPEPGIYINEWGVEPRFYPHRESGRLLEFYRIRSLK